MKKRLSLVVLISIICLDAFSQDLEKYEYVRLRGAFFSDWLQFRLYQDPTLPREKTHNEYGQWRHSLALLPGEGQFVLDGYRPEITVRKWGITPPGFVNLGLSTHFYLVEKENGLPSIKRERYPDRIVDSINIYVNDSIFPYDNRFLAIKVGERYEFCSGNAMWSQWEGIVPFRPRVDIVGYVRGVQFGVERVRPYKAKFSEEIRALRPDFPDYEYTVAHESLLTRARLLIAAPRGKETELIEYIYYTNDSIKTHDPNPDNYYEMRYIIPTEIKSIKERRLEKRLLRPEEVEAVMPNNPLVYYREMPPPNHIREEIILERPKE